MSTKTHHFVGPVMELGCDAVLFFDAHHAGFLDCWGHQLGGLGSAAERGGIVDSSRDCLDVADFHNVIFGKAVEGVVNKPHRFIIIV